MRLGIVTATTDPERARPCIESWESTAAGPLSILVVVNGRPYTVEEAEQTGLQASWLTDPQYLGTVAAFRRGVDELLSRPEPPDIIACLHDDFRIDESRWDEKVLRHFEKHPSCGLMGFGGAVGLGDQDLYQKPYDPMQLARIGFRSNLVDAEKHGTRSLLPEKVACLDGFSQVGRKEFWAGRDGRTGDEPKSTQDRPWTVLHDLGFVHHFYDGALGCLAARYGWDTWYLPLRGQHLGGQTAVGDRGYQDWAKTQVEGGDHGFWEAAHRAGYENFRDVLPLRV